MDNDNNNNNNNNAKGYLICFITIFLGIIAIKIFYNPGLQSTHESKLNIINLLMFINFDRIMHLVEFVLLITIIKKLNKLLKQ